jgi:hypothetical protein
MPRVAKILRTAAALMLVAAPLLGGAQTSGDTLDGYISKSVAEADSLDSPTIKEWATRHPGEVVEDPPKKGSDYDPANLWNLSPRLQQDMKLEGRWCLRSLAQIELAGGIHVQRVAVFYQPLVVDIYGKPLPPLPTEVGETLRNQRCRLVKIFHEFRGVPTSLSFLETIAKLMPGKRMEGPGRFPEVAKNAYWKPTYSFEKFGQPLSNHDLFVRDPNLADAQDQPAVLLEWQRGTSEYGQPSSKKIDPEAGQPWLALRAAMLANLPAKPTLQMLSFLAPQVGDPWEQAPLQCERQLILVLRNWFDLAARSSPQQHAAAILLADRVLGRLQDCDEFFDFGSYRPPEEEKIRVRDRASLEKDLQKMGIQTESTRLGVVYYAGNLREEVLKLAPGGAANKLGRMAILDDRCHWDFNSDSADCDKIIKEGEAFLKAFPEDEWTPSVHLILAEAYALADSNSGDQFSSTTAETRAEWEKNAAEHYSAWYAKSKNERDRPLVWQEIWALKAGLGPWLMTPTQSSVP